MSDDQHGTQVQPPFPFAHPPSMPPPPAPQHLQNEQMSNPLISQTFMAWLQYMQLQMQLQQQQTAQPPPLQPSPQTPQQPQQQMHVPVPNIFNIPSTSNARQPSLHDPVSLTSPEASGSASVPMSTPSPEAGEGGDEDPTVITEEKRKRNTAASARFRVKKKQWTLNLERSITDLSGRVEELEREAAELRRENGWLKEIVMLKSKRFGGSAPESEPSTSSLRDPDTSMNTTTSEEDNGKDVQKGKGLI
ncbi:hypothetical protein PHLCEN_2v990 [Hermanssonia centrifuga]|uniref:BZIP domain-containing protein n=1 Tax=Hermanssonia centrifuga TaxID=98765 RepID=A0A2R6S4A4_9APHY|nr:hypothetical protein PHLCEN_2v990 [Hermanssonia centrifuga]